MPDGFFCSEPVANGMDFWSNYLFLPLLWLLFRSVSPAPSWCWSTRIIMCMRTPSGDVNAQFSLDFSWDLGSKIRTPCTAANSRSRPARSILIPWPCLFDNAPTCVVKSLSCPWINRMLRITYRLKCDLERCYGIVIRWHLFICQRDRYTLVTVCLQHGSHLNQTWFFCAKEESKKKRKKNNEKIQVVNFLCLNRYICTLFEIYLPHHDIWYSHYGRERDTFLCCALTRAVWQGRVLKNRSCLHYTRVLFDRHMMTRR
jgi:hypothetical protein